jgi:hypothetical protein
MQIIDQNARAYGMPNGAALLGNPDDSIRIGIAIFRDALDGRAMSDPIVGARMYNGCYGCKNGHAPCSGVGLFGVGGQNDYATKFAMAANTFIAMDLEPVSKSSTFMNVAKGAALFGVGALLVTAIYTQRQRLW